MSVRRRLEKLEMRASNATSERSIPIELSVHLKAVARHQARAKGEEPPPYSREEVAHLREEDLETVAGGGVVGQFRDSPGWTSEEDKALLDCWEQDSRERLEKAKGPPSERWHEIWGVDDVEEPDEEGSKK